MEETGGKSVSQCSRVCVCVHFNILFLCIQVCIVFQGRGKEWHNNEKKLVALAKEKIARLLKCE